MHNVNFTDSNWNGPSERKVLCTECKNTKIRGTLSNPTQTKWNWEKMWINMFAVTRIPKKWNVK